MFSKPSLATRNEVISKKEVRTVLGSTSSPGTAQAAESSVKTAQPGGVGEVRNASPAASSEPTANLAENTMGARLIVGPDVKLKGAEILDCDTLVVEGRVEATMDSRVIRIADQGAFAGKVSIDIAEIHGTFEGELTARSQLIIHATGRVNGKIRYGKLVIDEGGELCGDVNSISADKAMPTKAYTETAPILGAIAG